MRGAAIPCGPVSASSMKLIRDEVREGLPISEQHMATAIELDAQLWSNHLDRIRPRFERWLQQPVRVPRALPR